jgi:hypothetical protein
MKRLAWIMCVVVLVATVTVTVLYGQGGGGGRGAGAGRGAMEMERVKLALEGMGLSEAELAAAQKTAEAKIRARRTLMDELTKLREAADNPQATEEQLKAAVQAYSKALVAYNTAVQNEDSALLKQLSPRSQAKLLAAGALENGLGLGRPRQAGGRRGGAGGAGAPPPPPPAQD